MAIRDRVLGVCFDRRYGRPSTQGLQVPSCEESKTEGRQHSDVKERGVKEHCCEVWQQQGALEGNTDPLFADPLFLIFEGSQERDDNVH